MHHRLVQVPMLYQLFESFPPCPLFLFLPPYRYLKCDLLQYSLSNLGSKFDVICIDPPLEEYTRRYSGFQFHQHMWDFEEVGVGHCVGVGWGDCRVTVRMCLACETLKTLYLSRVYLHVLPDGVLTGVFVTRGCVGRWVCVNHAYTEESNKDESYVIFTLIVVSTPTPPPHNVPFFICLNS